MITTELYASRETKTGRSPTAKLMFMVGQTIDEREVREAVLLESPEFYEIPQLGRLSTQQHHLGGGWWSAEVNYGVETRHSKKDPNNGGGDKTSGKEKLGMEVKLDGQVDKVTVTQGIYLAGSYKRTAETREIPDYGLTVGVSKGGVHGCEIPVPKLIWTETWTFQTWFITWDYVRRLSDWQGRVNGLPGGKYRDNDGNLITLPDDLAYSGTFRSFPVGEVMFLNWSSEQEGIDKARFHFTFHRSPNVYIPAGDFDPDAAAFDPTHGSWPAIVKGGHEFLWCDYEDVPMNTAIVKRPRAVYVHGVGRPGLEDKFGNPTNAIDFRLLGIGA
jgi:hypothetical protein